MAPTWDSEEDRYMDPRVFLDPTGGDRAAGDVFPRQGQFSSLSQFDQHVDQIFARDGDEDAEHEIEDQVPAQHLPSHAVDDVPTSDRPLPGEYYAAQKSHPTPTRDRERSQTRSSLRWKNSMHVWRALGRKR